MLNQSDCIHLKGATANQHPPEHHPLHVRYYSVVDEAQLS